jgi:hypothetical protein
MEWKPIETAKKSSKPILGFGDGVAIEQCVYIMEWSEGDGWICWYSEVDLNPTHWMHLPRPPGTP